MDCLCLIILSMVKVRTVNLSELAQGLDNGKKLKTKQRRLQRFFEKSDIDVNKFAIFIINSCYAEFRSVLVFYLLQ